MNKTARLLHAVLLCGLVSSTFAEDGKKETTPSSPHAKYMGVGSCASSVCHGSVTARKGSNILNNEYVSWQKYDKHSEAWTVLLNEDSKRIGFNLGIAKPEDEELCLSCHATYDRAHDEKVSDAKVKDGVGCESCHGAAEHYLETHAQDNATHAQNVHNGLRDMSNLTTRARNCLSCHLGEGEHLVTHRLIGAGHPRLTFELDTFGIAQPYHWVVDEDYIKRKGGYNPVRAWLVGQAVRAQELLKLVSGRSHRGTVYPGAAYPELTTFYCYTCHHSLAEKQWKKRNYDKKPGELRINLSSFLIVREGAVILAAGELPAYDAMLRAIHEKPTEVQSTPLDVLQERFEKTVISPEIAKKLLQQLINFGLREPFQQYEVAEQVAMGISSIVSYLNLSEPVLRTEIDKLYTALGQPNAYDPEQFAKALSVIAERVKGSS